MKARWAGFIEWLYQADTPAVELDVRRVNIPIADPSINCDPLLFVETQAAVNRLKWGKALGIHFGGMVCSLSPLEAGFLACLESAARLLF